MAAAARPPGLGDARVPCPLCGGLIHPVAGRCKHCKEDLSQLRAGRPQAAAVLPALNGKVMPAQPQAQVAGNGTSVHVDTAVPIAISARDGSAPILPQRSQSRSMPVQGRRGSLLRNWPMLVIILAMIAIVGAVVIMVLPPDKENAGGKRQLMPTPAPDRMETSPMPDKHGQANPNPSDPWATPGDPYAAPDPQANIPQPRMTPDPPRGAPDPDDLFNGLGSSLNSMFLLTLANQACKKLKACPGADHSTLDVVCDGFASMPIPPIPTSCAAAQRCLEAIDKMDCDTSAGSVNPLSSVMLMQDCVKAATEC